MSRIEFTPGNVQWIVPLPGHILRVRHRLAGHQTIDFIFCDHGKRTGQLLQLTGCRAKALLFQHQAACDYALKIGLTTINCEQVSEIWQLPTPGWYHRREADARQLADRLWEGASASKLNSLFQIDATLA